eukprot:5341990-Lingulodinium_polyedra.AAC.1
MRGISWAATPRARPPRTSTRALRTRTGTLRTSTVTLRSSSSFKGMPRGPDPRFPWAARGTRG